VQQRCAREQALPAFAAYRLWPPARPADTATYKRFAYLAQPICRRSIPVTATQPPLRRCYRRNSTRKFASQHGCSALCMVARLCAWLRSTAEKGRFWAGKKPAILVFFLCVHVATDLPDFRSQQPVATRNRFLNRLQPIFRLQLPISSGDSRPADFAADRVFSSLRRRRKFQIVVWDGASSSGTATFRCQYIRSYIRSYIHSVHVHPTPDASSTGPSPAAPPAGRERRRPRSTRASGAWRPSPRPART
jgi:hypothetical protein